nr:hypothetical protein [Serratia proteamaculans]
MKLLRTPENALGTIHPATVRTFLLGALCLMALLVSGLGISLANAESYISTDRYWETWGSTGAGAFLQRNWSGRWEWSSQSGDTPICNQKCTIALCKRTGSVGGDMISCGFGGTQLFSVKYIAAPAGTTGSQAQQLWAKKYGTSGTWLINGWVGQVSTADCFGIVIFQGAGDLSEVFPGSHCGKIPPRDLACDTSGKVTLDYGTLEAGKLNDATTNTTLSFTCNQAATATMKLNANVIDLGRKGDLTAAISIAGKDLAAGSDIAVTNGTVTTTITSTLKAKGIPAAGPFEGSGVLIISYQ